MRMEKIERSLEELTDQEVDKLWSGFLGEKLTQELIDKAMPVFSETLIRDVDLPKDEFSFQLIQKLFPLLSQRMNLLELPDAEIEFIVHQPENKRLYWPEGAPLGFTRLLRKGDGKFVGWVRFEEVDKGKFGLRDFVPTLSTEKKKGLPPFLGISRLDFLATSEAVLVMPNYERFIDLSCSSGSFLFAKPFSKGKVEILNFQDKGLKQAFEFLKLVPQDYLRKIKERNWEASDPVWKELKSSFPDSDPDRFYRTVYLSWASFDNQRKKFASSRKKKKWWGLPYLSSFRQRLSSVVISEEDPISLLEKAEDSDFLVLQISRGQEFRVPERLLECLEKTKGKVLLINPTFEAPKNFSIYKMNVDEGKAFPSSIFLAYNYSLRKEESVIERVVSVDVSSLEDEEIIKFHGEVHLEWEKRGSRADDELAVNAHLILIEEMKKRGLEHRPNEKLDELTLGYSELDLGGVMPKLQTSFSIADPFLALTGSLAVGGKGNDIDLWVSSLEQKDLLEIVSFRLNSMLPENLKGKIHLVPSNRPPFTNYIPFARLRVEILPGIRQKLIAMGEEKDESASETIKFFEDLGFEISKVGITPCTFFIPLKVMGKGYRKAETYSIEGLLKELKEEFFPYIVEMKFDGMRVQIHKGKGQVKIFSDNGKDITSRFPTAVASLEELEVESLVLDAECTGILDEKHIGRSDVAGYVHSKEKPDDTPFTFNIFDCVFLENRDLSGEPLRTRKSALKSLHLKGECFHKIEYDVVGKASEIKKSVNHFSNLPHSEGAMLKSYQADYALTGRSTDWVKFKKEVDLDAEVVQKTRTKSGAFNYLCVIRDGKKKIPVGNTYNTRQDVDVGRIIRVAFVNLNKYTDPKTGEIWFNWVFPRFLEVREDKKLPDNLNTALRVNKDTHGEVDEKTYPKRYAALLKGVLELSKKSHPKHYAVIQAHFRGKSLHYDFRRKMNGWLEGETLLVQPEGLIKEEVTSVKQGREIIERFQNEWKFRPGMDPNKKVVVEPKAKQPLEWLDMAPGTVEPGTVGATKEGPGVFTLVDSGFAYPGVKKPYFKEFFLVMKKFKGRMVERIVGWREDPEGKPTPGIRLQWQAWMCKDEEGSQVPYILTRRARIRKDYVPKEGEKAIPPLWEKRIPEQFRWWKDGLSPKERMKRLDQAYNFLIDQKEIKARHIEVSKRTARFILRVIWYKGQTVIRDVPRRKWDILIDEGGRSLTRWELKSSPLVNPSSIAVKSTLTKKTPDGKPTIQWMRWEGQLPPSDPENPTKTLPLNIHIIDSGNLEIYESSDQFWSLRFNGKELKGYWTIIRESPGSDIWTLSQSKLPIKKSAQIMFLKKDDEKHFVLGPVLLPDRIDLQQDTISREEIENSCHAFLREQGIIGVGHQDLDRRLIVLENYVLLEDLEIGGRKLPKGTWMLGVEVLDEEIWKMVKEGDLRGYSVKGWAHVTSEERSRE